MVSNNEGISKFGAIGVFGRANAGKSTLINALVGEKVSIVSSRPQTTRKRVLGVLTKADAQLVFCDTPGLHPIRNKLDAFMDNEIRETLKGLEGAIYLIDAADPRPLEDASYIPQIFSEIKGPIFLVVNKIDLLPHDKLSEIAQAFSSLGAFSGTFFISATRDKGLRELSAKLFSILPDGPHAYDPDSYTSMSEREIAEEIIREEILERYYHEVPHSVAVVVEQFKDRENGKTFIEANLIIEKEGQKRIIIGENGKEIKALGIAAREKLNSILGRDIFLKLWVKVRQNWRKREDWVKFLGYRPR